MILSHLSQIRSIVKAERLLVYVTGYHDRSRSSEVSLWTGTGTVLQLKSSAACLRRAWWHCAEVMALLVAGKLDIQFVAAYARKRLHWVERGDPTRIPVQFAVTL
jgi:hypothetical protein